MNPVQTFTGALEKGDKALGWTIVRVPFDPAAVWPQRVRLRVRGTVNGFSFRTSLFSEAGRQATYYLLVNGDMQSGGNAHAGQTAAFTLEPDLDPRPAELPAEMEDLLEEEAGLRAWYEALTESMRREIGKWIASVKGGDARARRARQMAERMLATMEAEEELPPAMRCALDRRPRAREGWSKMTDAQRRTEIFGVLYYQSPEAREKRIAKLVDAAEKRCG